MLWRFSSIGVTTERKSESEESYPSSSSLSDDALDEEESYPYSNSTAIWSVRSVLCLVRRNRRRSYSVFHLRSDIVFGSNLKLLLLAMWTNCHGGLVLVIVDQCHGGLVLVIGSLAFLFMEKLGSLTKFSYVMSEQAGRLLRAKKRQGLSVPSRQNRTKNCRCRKPLLSTIQYARAHATESQLRGVHTGNVFRKPLLQA